MSILRKFGFGQRAMETKILTEVEEMINKVREQQGRPFDMRQLTTSCLSNVLMSMMLGRRFDHSDPEFREFLSNMDTFFALFPFATAGVFPALRFFPYFKQNFTGFITAMKYGVDFVYSNIPTCREVSDFF